MATCAGVVDSGSLAGELLGLLETIVHDPLTQNQFIQHLVFSIRHLSSIIHPP